VEHGLKGADGKTPPEEVHPDIIARLDAVKEVLLDSDFEYSKRLDFTLNRSSSLREMLSTLEAEMYITLNDVLTVTEKDLARALRMVEEKREEVRVLRAALAVLKPPPVYQKSPQEDPEENLDDLPF
jgi:hypothetical protein